MSTTVRVPTIMRQHTNGRDQIVVEGDTLEAVLRHLAATQPDLTRRLVNEQFRVHRFINIYVNDEDVRYTGDLETPVPVGADITIVPAVAGG